MKKTLALGIDIGGTKILIGIINAAGNVIGRLNKIATNASEPSEKILNNIIDAVEVTLKSASLSLAEISGIGLGVPGPLDIKHGIILDPWQLPTLQNYPLVQVFKERFPIPVFMDNDANCFVLGESYFGAGKNSDIVLGITLGTGLGCGIVINQKIFLGATETAGEVWISPYSGGIIEDKISGKGLQRIYQNKAGRNLTPKEILEHAAANDPIALQAWSELGEHLAYCIAWSVNLLDPDIVVLGGSLSKGFEYFAPTLESRLRKWINPVPAQRLKVVNAALGDTGGMVGAACLVLQEKDKRSA
jgi:glucokinase